jgi:hypothetical protein
VPAAEQVESPRQRAPVPSPIVTVPLPAPIAPAAAPAVAIADADAPALTGSDVDIGLSIVGRARVVFDFASTHETELELKEGEEGACDGDSHGMLTRNAIVDITMRIDSEWLEGMTADGRVGLFPATYVEEISS